MRGGDLPTFVRGLADGMRRVSREFLWWHARPQSPFIRLAKRHVRTAHAWTRPVHAISASVGASVRMAGATPACG